jgi:nucleosome binding factor SPN SPT16 subunit
MSSLTIDKNYFIERATGIYNAWETDEDMKPIDTLIFCIGTNQEEIPYSKSQSLQV